MGKRLSGQSFPLYLAEKEKFKRGYPAIARPWSVRDNVLFSRSHSLLLRILCFCALAAASGDAGLIEAASRKKGKEWWEVPQGSALGRDDDAYVGNTGQEGAAHDVANLHLSLQGAVDGEGTQRHGVPEAGDAGAELMALGVGDVADEGVGGLLPLGGVGLQTRGDQ